MGVRTDVIPSRRPISLRRPRLLSSARGVLGVTLLALVVGIAAIGPLVAPHPLDDPIGIPGSGPSSAAPLGTDLLGRDVLSRVLHGGWEVLWISAVAVALTYLVGITIGMVAALSRSWLDGFLMRCVDLFMAFPPLLLLLILIAGAGSSTWTIVVGMVLVLSPGVARIVRTATLEISTTGYIEAAVSRGERMVALMRREILPNITPALIADGGVRFLGAIFLTATLSFLGVGAQPPSANWALMIAENRAVLATNIWAVLAPALLLGLLAVSVNLIGDAYAHSQDRSRDRG